MTYDRPLGRWLNVLAAVERDGAVPALHWIGYGGTWRGEPLVRALVELLD